MTMLLCLRFAMIALLSSASGIAAAEDPPDADTEAEKQARLSEMLCAQYGPDYVLVAGTTTCIKATGHVQVDVYVGPGKRR